MPSKLECKSFQVQTIIGLVADAAHLRQGSADVRKGIEKRHTKLASLEDDGDEINGAQKEVAKVMMSVMMARENHLFADSLMHKREIAVALLRE